ncbi:nucleoporin Nup186/Nup192/Nup205 [Lipomyces japonicus]|uniref:nucleoporin Nup186/Nup192/Nup205 n=1 Tax=Lipomyces japonicus TaxID=56871 RepID=UPI0034CEBBDC
MTISWSKQPYINLYSQLCTPDDISASILSAELEKRAADLQNLLSCPAKNDESRKAISGGKLEIDGTEYSINPEFITESCLLADELGIDEKVAAALLHYGTEEQVSLDRSPLHCSIIVYHLRRQYVLECIRLIFEISRNKDFKSSPIVEEFSKKLATKDFVNLTIKTMSVLREELRQLQEKETSGHFLGRDLDESFVENIKYRRQAVLTELGSVSSILVLISQNRFTTTEQFKIYLDDLLQLEKYNQILLYYIPPIIAFFDSICSLGDINSFSGASEAFEEAYVCHTYFSERQRKPPTQLPLFHSSIDLWWYAHFAGLCLGERDLAAKKKVDYVIDVVTPALNAIVNGGAFEFMMVIASNTASINEVGTNYNDFQSFLRSKTIISLPATIPSNPSSTTGVLLDIEIHYPFSTVFEATFIQSLSYLAEAIISNLADILKELKEKEEDQIFGQDRPEISEHDSIPSGDESNQVDFELEKFFIYISHIYGGRPDNALQFWTDPESNLYGFLTWASQCQTPLMIATYCDMLASLSYGPESSILAHSFLKNDDIGTAISSNSLTRDSTIHRLGYEYIFEAFGYYISNLRNVSQEQNIFGTSTGASSARSLITVADLPKLDDEGCMIVSAYLRLLETVGSWSPIARSELVDSGSPNNAFVPLIYLLECRTPLTGPIFNAIRAFATDADKRTRNTLWEALDSWLFNSPVFVSRMPAAYSGTYGGSQRLSLKERFNILLTSYADILGFVRLVEQFTRLSKTDTVYDVPFPENLGSKYRSPSGIRPYIDIIIDDVFYNTNAPALTDKQRLALQIECLNFISNCIHNFSVSLVAIASATTSGDPSVPGVNVELAVQPEGLAEYLWAHPCVWVMEKLFDDRIYNVIFGIASVGIDAISSSAVNHDLTSKNVKLALKVIYRVLSIEGVYLDVLEPNARKLSAAGQRSVNDDGVYVSSRPLNGLQNFEDAILFNMYIVTNCALYVNAEQVGVASLAIKILDRIASAPQFLNMDYEAPISGAYANGAIPNIMAKTPFASGAVSGRRIGVNRLLSALDAVDESKRIIFGFIEQLGRPEEEDANNEVIDLKLQILQFISRNLSRRTSSGGYIDSKDSSITEADQLSLSDVPTVSHFLLGFTIGDGGALSGNTVLRGSESPGGIESSISLFQSIVNLLKTCISNSTASYSYSYYTKQMASMEQAASEIIYKLCSAKISSEVTLKLLRSNDVKFFETRVSSEPLVTPNNSRWGDYTFLQLSDIPPADVTLDYESESQFKEMPQEQCVATFVQFLASRTSYLEYCAIEIHSLRDPITLKFIKKVFLLISMRGVYEESEFDRYNEERLPFASETAKLLELLDFLEFDVEKLATSWNIVGSSGGVLSRLDAISQQQQIEGEQYFSGIKLDEVCLYALPAVRSANPGNEYSEVPLEYLYDIEKVKGLLELKIRELFKTGRITEDIPPHIYKQQLRIVQQCKLYNAVLSLRRAQSLCVAAWCRLLRVILIDTTEKTDKAKVTDLRLPGRETFILEAMQVIAPKLLHYSHIWESNVAEHLASTVLSLVSASQQPTKDDNSTIEAYDVVDDHDEDEDAIVDIVHTLFRVVLIAVQSPYATASVRADLYTLINIFICGQPRKKRKLLQLQRTIESCVHGAELNEYVSVDDKISGTKENKLLERIGTDAVSGEGTTRIMGLAVLRSFVAIENVTKKYFVLDALVRYNLLLLIVRSVRRIDEDLDDQNRVSNYEITAFKAVMGFLTELAQSRQGSGQIIQAGIFTVLQNAQFLSIDPDVGIFTFSSSSTGKSGGPANDWWNDLKLGTSRNVYFEIIAPTLRLLTCFVLSMGERNVGILRLVKDLLHKHVLLVRAILHRVVNRNLSRGGVDEDQSEVGESGRLIVLLASLTGYYNVEDQTIQ